jgi:hypothetical protein
MRAVAASHRFAALGGQSGVTSREERMASDQPSLVYQIKVSLDDIRPPVWRRFVVPGGATLSKLHNILQVVMGWEDYHLHQFTIAGKRYGDAGQDEFGELGFMDERRYSLSQLLPRKGLRFKYEYDFGDSWQHTLVVEEILPSKKGVRYPACLAGKRACPPEDVGGVWGYAEYLAALEDPGHPGHDEWLQWRGAFDPEAFDLRKVNAELKRPGRSRSSRAEADDWWAEAEAVTAVLAPPAGWLEQIPPDQPAAAESLPLRRDMLALLAYLRDHKVSGTQATGSLPLKAAREISSQFVDPPKFEEVVGDHMFRVRSASDVWPLFFVHVLASVGGLVSGGRSRRWRLTPAGEAFPQASPPVQVLHLFTAWWTRVNWLLALRYWSAGDTLPPGFESITRQRLLSLPLGEATAFEPFADGLTSAGGLEFPHPDEAWAREMLRSSVERMVMRPLSDFGAVQLDHRPKTLEGGYTFQELSAFRITPFGRLLLEAQPA